MRAGMGSLFVGFHCKLPRHGQSVALRRVDWKQEKEFFFCRDDAGMLLKTKDSYWTTWRQSGNLVDYA